jgi:hypothetical protein
MAAERRGRQWAAAREGRLHRPWGATHRSGQMLQQMSVPPRPLLPQPSVGAAAPYCKRHPR